MGHIMTIYFQTSTNESDVLADLAVINTHMGLPNGMGTDQWDVPQQSVDGALWFFASPDWNNGIQGLNEADMYTTRMPRDDNWFPAPPFIGGGV